MPNSGAYGDDLAYIHDVGYTTFARELSPGLLETLHAAGAHGGLVVDLGCGSGVWARDLIDAGYRVIGVDMSQSFVALARRRVPEAKFNTASFLDYQLPQCRAVTALGEVLCYRFDRRNGTRRLGQLFNRVYASLEAGGLFLFDVAEPDRQRRADRNFREGDDWAALVEYHNDVRKQELTRRVVTFRKVGRHYRRGEEIHRLKLYRCAEVAEMLRSSGFRVRAVRRYGRYQLPESLVGFIARKP